MDSLGLNLSLNLNLMLHDLGQIMVFPCLFSHLETGDNNVTCLRGDMRIHQLNGGKDLKAMPS